MEIKWIVAVLVLCFLMVAGAYKYWKEKPLLQWGIYIIVAIALSVLLFRLVGILPGNILNHKV